MDEKSFAPNFPGELVTTVHRFKAFVPNPLPPDLALSDTVRQADEEALLALGELRAIIPALPNPKLITEPFLRREAVLSSKIEGTNTELEGLYLFETLHHDQPSTPEDDPAQADAREVSNYVDALQLGLELIQEWPICGKVLKECHATLLHGVDRHRGAYKGPGEYRKVQAFIGSVPQTARFVPPPEDRVESLMSGLEKYINSNSGLPTLVDLALIHYQFEAIHPFSDGNGRVGRLLILLQLISKKVLPGPLLYLSAYFERFKDEYVRLLWEVSRQGAWEQWIVFFLQGIIEESRDACERARNLLALRESLRADFQKTASAAKSLALVDALFNWPVVTAASAKRLIGLTHQGAQNNIDRLVAKGILVEVTGKDRGRMYVARPIIQLMS